jgi:hypothetical protein
VRLLTRAANKNVSERYMSVGSLISCRTRASSGSLDSQMYALRPLMIPAPSLATMPARRSLLRIAFVGRTLHSIHRSYKVTIGFADSRCRSSFSSMTGLP